MICACPTCGGDIDGIPAVWDAERGIIIANGRFALLTNQEARAVQSLIDRWPGIATKEQMHSDMYAHDPDGGAEIKIIDVLVCKVRRKVKGMGIDITTHWGSGYALSCNLRRVSPKGRAT